MDIHHGKILSVERTLGGDLVCVNEGMRKIGRVKSIGQTEVTDLSDEAIVQLLIRGGASEITLASSVDSEGDDAAAVESISPPSVSLTTLTGDFAISRREVLRVVEVEDGPLRVDVKAKGDERETRGLRVWQSTHPVIRKGDIIASVNGVALGPLPKADAVKVLRASRHRTLVLLEDKNDSAESDGGGECAVAATKGGGMGTNSNKSEKKGRKRQEEESGGDEGGGQTRESTDDDDDDQDQDQDKSRAKTWRAMKQRYMTRYRTAQDARVTRSTGSLGSENLVKLSVTKPQEASRVYPASNLHDSGGSDLANIIRRCRKRAYSREVRALWI